MPYLTERFFALAMTAIDVSAIGRSNVERPTPDVQSKRDQRGLIHRFSSDFASGADVFSLQKVRFGEPPKPAREPRALPSRMQSPRSRMGLVSLPRNPMSEVSDQLRAAALARARSSQAARKAFISARSTTIRLATPLYFFVVPVTVRLTAPWCTRP